MNNCNKPPNGNCPKEFAESVGNKVKKKIKLFPYQDIIEELLKKEKGWIAELASLQQELTDKTLHLLQEDNKRGEKYIKVLEEMRELLQDIKNENKTKV